MLYKEDLDAMHCGHCEKNAYPHQKLMGGPEFYFHGRCHITSPTWTSYEDGVLTITCAECKKVIAKIAVKNREAGSKSADKTA